jgi:hypothetical protein
MTILIDCSIFVFKKKKSFDLKIIPTQRIIKVQMRKNSKKNLREILE